MYENNAYRSWYWSSNISALSTGLIGNISPQKKIFLNYPDFLRRVNDSKIKNDIIKKISLLFDINTNSSKNEFYPLILGFQSNEINEKWSSDFTISKKHGLSFSEHAKMTGINLTSKYSKTLNEKYTENYNDSEIKKEEFENEDKKPSGQSTLF